jgi:hypothetical protein
VRRRQLEEMLKAEQNRLRTLSPSLKSSRERSIVYAQALNYPQCDDEAPAALPRIIIPLCQLNKKTATALTNKTVAARSVRRLHCLSLHQAVKLSM